jgi:hypothetical protein
MSLGFGIGFGGIGLGLGLGKYINEGKITARLLLSGENVNLHFLTDSKLASPMNQFLLASCPAIAWGGTLEQGSYWAFNNTSTWTSAFGASYSGDVRGLLVGSYYQDEVGLSRNCSVQFASGTAPVSQDTSWISYISYSAVRYPLMFSRAIAGGGAKIAIGARKLGATGQVGLRVQARTYTPDVWNNNDIVLSDVTQVTVKDFAWDADGVAARLSITPSTVTGTGLIGVNGIVVRAVNGVTCFSWGVGGSTINRWNDDVTFSEAHRQLLNSYDTALDAVPVYWIDLGTNWVVGDTVETFSNKMISIIDKISISSPNARFVISTAYPDSSSNPGFSAPWVYAANIVAKKRPVLVIDTFSNALSYADAVAAGYFTLPADPVHYNSTGKHYQCGLISDLLTLAAA